MRMKEQKPALDFQEFCARFQKKASASSTRVAYAAYEAHLQLINEMPPDTNYIEKLSNRDNKN